MTSSWLIPTPVSWIVSVRDPLSAMLEGQVAVLSSGALSAEKALSVLRALHQSELYRSDQHSYLLQPDRKLSGGVALLVLLKPVKITGAQLARACATE